MTIHNNYYGSNAEPAQTICPVLMHDIAAYLIRHKITPDPIIIKRILFKHAIAEEFDMYRAFGEVPFQRFLREYRTEVCKAI
jgi:hypothetical protein